MKISVVGVYQTRFGELWEKSLQDLIEEAISGCMKDCSLSSGVVDAVYVGNMLGGMIDNQVHLGALISQIMGRIVPVTRVEAACASGGLAIHTAVWAIHSGLIDNALVIGAEKMTDVDSETISQYLISAASAQESLAGLNFPGLYALIASKYAHQYDLKQTQLSEIPVKNHYHALNNPLAHFKLPITVDQVMKSPKVADPLKMLDCSPISDGAAAVFLASPAWVKKQQARNGVYITGSALANDGISLTHRDDLTTLSATKQAAFRAYKQAGVEASDIDCLEVHDCFSIAELIAMEDLGFYPKGQGVEGLMKRDSYLGNKRPVNTSGGLKACGHPVGATGVKQIVELTRQLRSEANNRQVEGAKLALAHNVGGSGGTAVVHILQK